MEKNWEDYLKGYTESEDALEIVRSSETLNPEGFDLWSFKKLIALEYYIKPFLNILRNNDFHCFFVDVYGGAGANKIERKDTNTIGSPMVSLLNGIFPVKKTGDIRRFDKWLFIEKNHKYKEALESRARKAIDIIGRENGTKLGIESDVFVYEGDCQERIDDVMKEIGKDHETDKIAILAFIDPYSLSDFSWTIIQKLSKFKHIDVIFTLPTSSFIRNIKNYKNPEKYLPPLKAEEKAVLKSGKFDEEWLAEVFAVGLCNELKCDIHFSRGAIVKNSKNSELYRIMIFSRSPAGPKILERLFDTLNKIQVRDIGTSIEKIKGKQSSLVNF
jgi:three-Cys-motif partner protein